MPLWRYCACTTMQQCRLFQNQLDPRQQRCLPQLPQALQRGPTASSTSSSREPCQQTLECNHQTKWWKAQIQTPSTRSSSIMQPVYKR
eukprot:2129333-Amphidinium_carterae.1